MIFLFLLLLFFFFLWIDISRSFYPFRNVGKCYIATCVVMLEIIKMDFPARIGKGNQITIPKSFMELDQLHEGDFVIVSVRKKDSVDHHKSNLERPFRKGD